MNVHQVKSGNTDFRKRQDSSSRHRRLQSFRRAIVVIFLIGVSACVAQAPSPVDSAQLAFDTELRSARQRRIEAGGPHRLPETPIEPRRHICWISKVRRTSSGVEVFFSDRRIVVRSRPGQEFIEVTVDSGAPVRASAETGFPVQAVPAILGDMLFIWIPHDDCRMRIVSKEGKIGVEASTLFQPPWMSGMTATDFIEAE